MKKLIRIDDYPGGRHYKTPEGNIYPSVTTFLSSFPKPALEAWKERLGEVEADLIARRAARVGTDLHNSLEEYLVKKPISSKSPIIRDLIKQATPILDQVSSIEHIEHQMYSDELRLAGTADLICNWRGLPMVIDYKTSFYQKSNDRLFDYFIQSTAYAIMCNEHKYKHFGLILLAESEVKARFVVREVAKYKQQLLDMINNYYKERR